jgi:UDP-glucuronate 4-epimerase
MTILVTGGAGFVGAALVKRLLTEGHTVVVVDNMNQYYDPALKRARLAEFKDKITFYEIDIADLAALEEVFKKHAFDKVCHLAAQAGVRYSLVDPYAYAKSNYVGTGNVLELARRYGSPHVVVASSSSVYGASTALPFTENDSCDHPLSIYASSKRAGELLASSYCSLFSMNITALRFFTVYGPWGRPDMALFSFTEHMLKGEPIEIFNNGDMKRDFTYIDDIVEGFMNALSKPMGYAVYNLGHGHPVALRDFVTTLEDALGIKAQTIDKPMQAGDMKETYASVAKAKRELGFEAKVSLEEGVPQFVAWYRRFYDR